jgi:hypothetical protein
VRQSDISQARYDNDEAKFNIRETLARLQGIGIKVVFDWNAAYGPGAVPGQGALSGPLDFQECLDQNWELRWRQAQLNALMEGTPLPKYTPRPASMSRVIPVGWKQCGSGTCNPGNPYCPYRSAGQ